VDVSTGLEFGCEQAPDSLEMEDDMQELLSRAFEERPDRHIWRNNWVGTVLGKESALKVNHSDRELVSRCHNETLLTCCIVIELNKAEEYVTRRHPILPNNAKHSTYIPTPSYSWRLKHCIHRPQDRSLLPHVQISCLSNRRRLFSLGCDGSCCC